METDVIRCYNKMPTIHIEKDREEAAGRLRRILRGRKESG